MTTRRGTRATWWAAAAGTVAVSPVAAQPPRSVEPGPGGTAFVRDVGPGPAGRLLRDVLARPHDVIVAPDTGLTLGRDTTLARTVLVLGGPVRLASPVRGDVVVVGDLFLRPGAVVDGRAIAYGGGVYDSELAVVRGGARAYRDVTFEARDDAATGQVALSYRDLERYPIRALSLPGVYGLRIPTYSRVDGLAVTVGPEVALRGGAVRVEPLVTYRSHLGAVDPGARSRVELGRRTAVELRVERATFTNDAWMRADLVNSAVTIAAGGDARNYYRADRGEATLVRRFETTVAEVVPFVGALLERAWSVPRDSATPAPFSAFGRDDALEGIRRPNPAVTGGTIASGVAGVGVRADAGGVASQGVARLEVPVDAPGGARFVQLTADASVSFAAFADHRVDLFAHAVATVGDSAPSQRFAYLGGGPTLPSLPLLSLGGDRLVWTETRYTIPIQALSLPFVGSPRLTFRHMLGGAGVGRLPALTQNVGIRLGLGPLRVDYTFDPAGRGDRDFSVGVGFR